ncbi:hypothetical protein [Candidatus Poriferisodalis sp.]|uniref:hypothetical protein n=1 Tax=Candidatus Poriferisodalis sp. TaxID=3101277 RepID=UPI003B026120
MTPRPQAADAGRAALCDESRGVPERSLAGLVTLEWLLVVAAAGGFAAAMAIGFHALIDQTASAHHSADADADADARLIDAGIAAARISDNAIAALIALEHASGDPGREAAAQARLDTLSAQCETLETAYPDVVGSADWVWVAVGVDIPALTPATAADIEPPPITVDSGTTREPVITAPTVETAPAPADDDAGAPALTDGRWVCQIGHRAP